MAGIPSLSEYLLRTKTMKQAVLVSVELRHRLVQIIKTELVKLAR